MNAHFLPLLTLLDRFGIVHESKREGEIERNGVDA